MPEKIIEVKEVTKEYLQGHLSVRAVQNVSISVGPGEFTVLAGPSGSGKTTLLNLIGGLDLPSSGEVRVGGFDLAELGDKRRAELRLRRIGFVFQAYNLIPVLSAEENVEYPLVLQGGISTVQRRQRARESLAAVGLADKAQRRPAELSGGEQQRVAVARAIVSSPTVVLADEPTANLDSRTALALIEMMWQLNRQRHVTFLFSSHDPKVIQRARRVIQMDNGSVFAEQQGSEGAA